MAAGPDLRPHCWDEPRGASLTSTYGLAPVGDEVRLPSTLMERQCFVETL